MKKLIFVIILIIGASYGYKTHTENPSTIADPVYLESRILVNMPKFSRDFEYVFVGEMVSEKDCARRQKKYLDRLFEKCELCNVHSSICKSDIPKRYKKLFSGRSTHTTHLSLNKGNRFERNGRMVIWGLSDKEASYACDIIRSKVKEKYEGTVNCVAGIEI